MSSVLQLVLFSIVFALNSCASQAQVAALGQASEEMLELEEIELPNGDIDFYARNKGVIPITLMIDFENISNMKPSVKMPFHIVLLPDEAAQFLFKMKRLSKHKDANYGFLYGFSLGNALKANHDEEAVYLLPFQPGKKQLVGQGNNGRFSHRGINAIDFNMETGTKVCAARGGIVAAIKEDSKQGCKSSKCKNLGNFILIYQPDGSFAHYGHLQFDGAFVALGDTVQAGQVIGLSGNTGWSSGPHLHFEVYTKKNQQVATFPVKFRLARQGAAYLEEGKVYQSVH